LSVENDRDPFLISQFQTSSQGSEVKLQPRRLPSSSQIAKLAFIEMVKGLGMDYFCVVAGRKGDYSAASEKRIGGAAPDF
jgi:hypothetical protein